jgi:hypothetical protein
MNVDIEMRGRYPDLEVMREFWDGESFGSHLPM